MSTVLTESSSPSSQLHALLCALEKLRSELIEMESRFASRLEQIHPDNRMSGENLLHYVALRQRERRPLQEKLAQFGLSSLGRSEPHVMANLMAVIHVLQQLVEVETAEAGEGRFIGFGEGIDLVKRRTEELLGPEPNGRGVRIMVTMPPEAANSYELVRDMMKHGMDCVRINCAHDDRVAWQCMVENIRRARRELDCPCRILMDLAGPKMRTGPIEPGPRVVKWKPQRDLHGRVTSPARVWVCDAGHNHVPDAADAVLPLSGIRLEEIDTGDQLVLRDARDKRRKFCVRSLAEGGCWAESVQTTYVTPNLPVQVIAAGQDQVKRSCRIGPLKPLEQDIVLKQGDTLVLTYPDRPGTPALYDHAGQLSRPAMIGCTPTQVFRDIRVGERVLFDDGKISGLVRAVDDEEVEIEITHARAKGEKLRNGKGINLPDTHLHLPALMPTDMEHLDFIVQHADMVGCSWLRDAQHIRAVQCELNRMGGEHLAIVLKIETQQAFQQLPNLLLESLRSRNVAVMIARGDLAVEVGYQRLAEVQEEILWMCEAAHVPVIWATQVLENLAKDGRPSRAEVTDAAMGERAECVMLNKGPYITAAIELLDDILGRMEGHQAKKRPMLRELRMAHGLQ